MFEEKSLSSVIYAKDPHLVADIFKVCSILTPPHPISRGKVACIKASMDQTSRQSFIPFCLSLQNCWLCPSGLSAPPEEFLLASLVEVKTLSLVISRNFVEYVFTFPFSVVNDICIVFHFGAEKMMFQVNCEGWRSGIGKALSNELITYFFSNHIIT